MSTNNISLISQTLDPLTTVLHDVELRHTKDKVSRLLPITTTDNKGYYVMTDLLEPKSVFCATDEVTDGHSKKRFVNSFRLYQHQSKQHDVQDDVQDNSTLLIDKLNKFQRGLTDRIRYMMLIPQYTDKKSFGLRMNTIRLNNIIKYKNIIEYQNKKNNFGFDVVKQVLMGCHCRLLLKINYLSITESNVVLNINVVRIIPEDLDNLSMNTKISIMGELNNVSSSNAEKYQTLDSVPKMTHVSKTTTKNDLMKIFNITSPATYAKNNNKSKYRSFTVQNVKTSSS